MRVDGGDCTDGGHFSKKRIEDNLEPRRTLAMFVNGRVEKYRLVGGFVSANK